VNSIGERMKTSMILVILGYRVITLFGCAYLVGWKGWSPWWFLLVVMTFTLINDDDKKDKS
jgi:hypothetical protein